MLLKCLTIIAVLVVFATPFVVQAGQVQPQEHLKAYQEMILSLNAKTSCQTDSDCKAAPMGRRGCGGPTSHVVYTFATVDEAALLALIRIYTITEKKLNDISGGTSICSVVMPPKLLCVESRCHTRAESWNSEGIQVPSVECRIAGEQRCLVK